MVLGLVLWSIQATPELWSLVAAYGAAWLLLNFVLRRRIRLPLTRLQTLVLAGLLVAPPLAALYRQHYTVLRREELRGLGEQTRDRLRLESASPTSTPGRPASTPTRT